MKYILGSCFLIHSAILFFWLGSSISLYLKWLWTKWQKNYSCHLVHYFVTFFSKLFCFLPLEFVVAHFELGFPGGTVVKNLLAISGSARTAGLIPGLGRSPGIGSGNLPLQYSCLENVINRGAWQAAFHGVANSQTQLSNCVLTHALNHFKLLCICCKFFLGVPCCCCCGC